jgi:type IV secretion system protein VirB10
MARFVQLAAVVSLAIAVSGPLRAIDPERDFSGRWVLDATANVPERLLTVVQNDSVLRGYASQADGTQLEWSYALNGDETRYAFGAERRNSIAKWEGAALLVNTLVSGPASYTVMDRWRLTRERTALTITRQVIRDGGQTETTLLYRREGAPASAPATVPAFSSESPSAAPAGNRPVLVVRPPATPAPMPAAAANAPVLDEYVVPSGTHILLSLRNGLDTKRSHEGDRVYLETVYPVTASNRIVVPKGSYVMGTVTNSKPAGTVKGKGELYIRFDSLTLPNGVTREFRSRLANADTPTGKVDRDEGKVTGERDTGREVKTTAEGAGIGATVGGIAGGAAGAPLKGVGIGAAAGAAAGLASVMMRHKPDATLPRGTTVEMVLDRELRYQRSELR